MIQSRGQPSALPQAPQRTVDSGGSTQNDTVDNSYFDEFSIDESEEHNRLSNEFESDKESMYQIDMRLLWISEHSLSFRIYSS